MTNPGAGEPPPPLKLRRPGQLIWMAVRTRRSKKIEVNHEEGNSR
jgi:hypothetical protein